VSDGGGEAFVEKVERFGGEALPDLFGHRLHRSGHVGLPVLKVFWEADHDRVDLFLCKIRFQVAQQCGAVDYIEGSSDDLEGVGNGEACSFFAVVNGEYPTHLIMTGLVMERLLHFVLQGHGLGKKYFVLDAGMCLQIFFEGDQLGIHHLYM
jgi:hypothetical protein